MRKPSVLLFAQLLLLPLLWSAAPVKPGSIVARWPIKTSVKSPGDLNETGMMLALTDFLALPPAAGKMSKTFESALFPKTPGAKFSEGDIVRTRGYIRLVAGESDGDYHMQLTTTPDTFDNCLVVEVPKDDPEFVHDPGVSAAAKSVRDFVMTQLKTGDPTGRIVVIVNPTYVEITGQLFFDAEHQAAMAKNIFRGKSIHGKQLPSKTSWEVHPIIKISFAPKPA
jgi:hypothetical protein